MKGDFCKLRMAKNALIYTKFTSIVMRVFLANLRAMCVVSFAMVVHSNLLCNFYLAVVVPSLMPPPLTAALLPTRVAIKKNSRRDAKQKEVIPLALSDLFQFYKIHQGTGLATLLALLSCKLRMHFFQLLFLLQQCESSLYFVYNKILLFGIQLGALVFKFWGSILTVLL